MQEVWKSIPGYEGLYEVSDAGQVRRISQRNSAITYPRKPRATKTGYLRVALCINHVSKDRYIHHLVLEAFVGPRGPGLECNHKNGIKGDNRADNLEYVTRSTNNLHAYRILGRQPKGPLQRGSANAKAILHESDFPLIRHMRDQGMSFTAIAKHFGVGRGTMRQACMGITWRHLRS